MGCVFGRRIASRAGWVAVAWLVAASAAQAGPFDAIYVLGDSLSDQGNLFQATQALTGAGTPASDHYFNGRFSNGEVYSGLLAQSLGLSLGASSLGGNNFAYGGARVDHNVVESTSTPGGAPPGLYPWSLNAETAAFAARNVNDPNALYVVFSGSNDVGDLVRPTLTQGFAATASQSNAAVQGVVDAVNAFKAAGARYVLVPNIPDLGVVPSVTQQNPPGSSAVSNVATALSARFNASLDAALANVTGVQIIRFDTFGFVDQLHDHPGAFGFANVSQPCYSGFVNPGGPSDTVCANPASFAYWDAEHPTTAAHALLADGMLTAVNAALVPEPQSAVMWLAGLALLAGAVSRKRAAGASSGPGSAG